MRLKIISQLINLALSGLGLGIACSGSILRSKINGKLMNLLFVCSENRLRSPTGEEVFSNYEGINAIGCGTNSDAETTVSGDLIEWADIVFVMERSHRSKVSKKFKDLLKGKKLVCLDIPDEYERMDPLLIRLLENRVMRHIPMTAARKKV